MIGHSYAAAWSRGPAPSRYRAQPLLSVMLIKVLKDTRRANRRVGELRVKQVLLAAISNLSLGDRIIKKRIFWKY